MGGFLSIASGLRNLELDLDSNLRVAGALRIIIAAISSLIINFVVEAQLIFPDLFYDSTDKITSTGESLKNLILIISGFSEKLVPNILKEQESKLIDNNSNKENFSNSLYSDYTV